MIGIVTDQRGTPVRIHIAGQEYTPDALVAALSNAIALQAALGLAMAHNAALLARCEAAETWVALLEAERKG